MCGGGSDTPEQTPEEKVLGQIAVDKWNDYQVRFKPIEDQFKHDVQMTESDFSQARGNANTAVQQGFSVAEDNLQDNIFMNGLDPSSGAFIKAMDGISMDRGLSLGTGLNEAEHSVDNRHVQGLQNVVAIGQGQSASAMNGLGEIAGNATNEAINRANNSFKNRSAGLNLVGNVAGAGTAYYMNGSSTTDKEG